MMRGLKQFFTDWCPVFLGLILWAAVAVTLIVKVM